MEILERVASLLERLVENARGQRDMHLEDRVGSEVWAVDGEVSLAPGASATVFTVTNPRAFGMSTHDLGVEATPAMWGATNGITYSLVRNESPFPHLSQIAFPWGALFDRKRLKLAFKSGESFSLIATNHSGTETIEVCAAATGMYYSAVRGITPDRVKS